MSDEVANVRAGPLPRRTSGALFPLAVASAFAERHLVVGLKGDPAGVQRQASLFSVQLTLEVVLCLRATRRRCAVCLSTGSRENPPRVSRSA